MRDQREQLDAYEDEGPKFSFDLSAPAPPPPVDIPPMIGLNPLDELAMDPPIVNPPTYQDLHLSAPAMIGTYDSWCGEVSKVYDSAADKTWGQKGVIEVRRSSPYWTADPTFGLDEIPPVDSQPQRSIEHAFPFPAVDQQAYRVAVGDPVVVVTGRDGKCYYLPDDRPFVGVVAQSPASASTKEANFGGAGNLTIKVTRQLLTGDPTDNSPAYGFTAIAAITYDHIYPLVAAGQHHGYRVGDKVLCFRRGMYMFCLPGRAAYHGKIVAAGPDSEADFTDERYWVEILTVNVAYTGDTNVWDWEADGASPFTIEAANMAEITAQTHSVKAGTEVLLTLMADTTAAPRPYCVFTHSSNPVLWGIPAATPGETPVSTIVVVPCSKAGVPTGESNVRVFIRDDRALVYLPPRGWLATVGETVGTILSYVALAETVTVAEGSVNGVLIGEGPANPPVEWGRPYSSSNEGEVTTILLVETTENGVDLVPEKQITVYIRNDQTAVDITDRDWTQDTVLSFVRSVKDSADVSGVLVGEAPYSGDGGIDTGGSFTETYYGDGTAESPSLDYTLAGCENAHLIIGLELRDIATGPNPGYKLPRMSGGTYQVAWGNTISGWDGDSSQWFSLMYCYVSYVGVTTHGIQVLSGIDMQARVTDGGALEFRVNNAGITSAFVIRGTIWRKTAPAAPGNVFGAGAPP